MTANGETGQVYKLGEVLNRQEDAAIRDGMVDYVATYLVGRTSGDEVGRLKQEAESILKSRLWTLGFYLRDRQLFVDLNEYILGLRRRTLIRHPDSQPIHNQRRDTRRAEAPLARRNRPSNRTLSRLPSCRTHFRHHRRRDVRRARCCPSSSGCSWRCRRSARRSAGRRSSASGCSRRAPGCRRSTTLRMFAGSGATTTPLPASGGNTPGHAAARRLVAAAAVVHVERRRLPRASGRASCVRCAARESGGIDFRYSAIACRSASVR